MSNTRRIVISTIVLCLVAYFGYFYFAIMSPKLEQIAGNLFKDTRSSTIKAKAWPWFGFQILNAKLSGNGYDIDVPEVDLELSLKDAAVGDYKINKVTIKNARGNVKAIQDILTGEIFGIKGVSLSEEISLGVINAKINDNISNLNIAAYNISKSMPYTLNVNCNWRNYPIEFSTLISNKDNLIKMDNSHLSLSDLSKNYVTSTLKINSDMTYDTVNKKMLFTNLVATTPELRAQGKIKVDLANGIITSGKIELPPSPCQQILNYIGYDVSETKEFLARCTGNFNWQEHELEFDISTEDLKANGKINLKDEASKGNTLEIYGSQIDIMQSVKKADLSIFDLFYKWFSQISWHDTQYNNFKIKDINCFKNADLMSCDANGDDNTKLKLKEMNLNSGTILLDNFNSKQIYNLLGVKPIINFDAEIAGSYTWQKNQGTLAYDGNITAKNITINNWNLEELISDKALSQKLVFTSTNKDSWQKATLVLRGLNDIMHIRKISLVRDKDSVSGHGIVDIGSGSLSLELTGAKHDYNILGKWPDSIQFISAPRDGFEPPTK